MKFNSIHVTGGTKSFGKKFIETSPCMLASAFNKKTFEAIKYPALVQTKMDGMRANIIIDADGKVDVRSRNGKQISLDGHFDMFVMQIFHKSATLDNLSDFHGAVLDGELVVLDEKEDKLDEAREKLIELEEEFDDLKLDMFLS